MHVQVRISFTTPLWSADATRQAHRVECTGLVGSLRTWYEALVRGVGGWACDPTGTDRCGLDADGTPPVFAR